MKRKFSEISPVVKMSMWDQKISEEKEGRAKAKKKAAQIASQHLMATPTHQNIPDTPGPQQTPMSSWGGDRSNYRGGSGAHRESPWGDIHYFCVSVMWVCV